MLKKYKTNPTDPTILAEYSDAAQKVTEMQTESTNSTDSKYASKLMTLANKIAKAAF